MPGSQIVERSRAKQVKRKYQTRVIWGRGGSTFALPKLRAFYASIFTISKHQYLGSWNRLPNTLVFLINELHRKKRSLQAHRTCRILFTFLLPKQTMINNPRESILNNTFSTSSTRYKRFVCYLIVTFCGLIIVFASRKTVEPPASTSVI